MKSAIFSVLRRIMTAQGMATCGRLALVCVFSGRLAIAQNTNALAAAADQLVQAVAEQGVTNPRVLDAIRMTPRHRFVSSTQQPLAYYDMALPIGSGQTISPPFVVASMTEKLDPQPTDNVLEIGTGSGYQAAVLSPLVTSVFSIEIVETLGRKAARTLRKIGYANVTTKTGDGFKGWPEYAPFDKIIVTCSPEQIPQPLIDQLRDGGRLVIPLGERFQQTLYLYTKVDGELREEALEPTFFVPMTGRAEELRSVTDDSGQPNLNNGSFEETAFGDRPAGWYYVRHGLVRTDSPVPDGQRQLTFDNDVPGRWAQALQAIGVDGRNVSEIEVTLSTRGRNVQAGPGDQTRFHGELTFFGDNRALVGKSEIAPRYGSYDWIRTSTRMQVPVRARTSVFAIGLSGGTGELAFDQIEIKVIK